jgi:hypothetical protein
MNRNLIGGLGSKPVRVVLKGIATATKRLADGTPVKYFYAWRGGPRLAGAPGDAEFVAAYNAAIAARRQPAKGKVAHLIATYKASTEFSGLAQRTKEDYSKHITAIELRFGNMPIAALTDKRSRGSFQKLAG